MGGSAEDEGVGETICDVVMALLYGSIFIVTMCLHKKYYNTAPSVKLVFWKLILCHSLLRAVWFAVPDTVWGATFRHSDDPDPGFGTEDPVVLYIEFVAGTLASALFLSVYLVIIGLWAMSLQAVWRQQYGTTRQLAAPTVLDGPKAYRLYVGVNACIYGLLAISYATYFFLSPFVAVMFRSTLVAIYALTATGGFLMFVLSTRFIDESNSSQASSRGEIFRSVRSAPWLVPASTDREGTDIQRTAYNTASRDSQSSLEVSSYYMNSLVDNPVTLNSVTDEMFAPHTSLATTFGTPVIRRGGPPNPAKLPKSPMRHGSNPKLPPQSPKKLASNSRLSPQSPGKLGSNSKLPPQSPVELASNSRTGSVADGRPIHPIPILPLPAAFSKQHTGSSARSRVSTPGSHFEVGVTPVELTQADNARSDLHGVVGRGRERRGRENSERPSPITRVSSSRRGSSSRSGSDYSDSEVSDSQRRWSRYTDRSSIGMFVNSVSSVHTHRTMRNIRYVATLCAISFLYRTVQIAVDMYWTCLEEFTGIDAIPDNWWVFVTCYYLFGEVCLSIAVDSAKRSRFHQKIARPPPIATHWLARWTTFVVIPGGSSPRILSSSSSSGLLIHALPPPKAHAHLRARASGRRKQ